MINDNTYDEHLGSLFHKFRLERNITLQQAFPGRPSTLSRFERGKNQLANHNMFITMSNIGMQFADLYDEIPEFHQTLPTAVKDLWHQRYGSSNSINSAAEDLRLLLPHINQPENEILEALLNYLKSGTRNRLSAKTEKQIIYRLSASTSWTIADFQLVQLSALFISNHALQSVLKMNGRRSANQFDGYRVYYQDSLVVVLLALMLNHAPIELRVNAATELETIIATTFDDEDVLLANSLITLSHLKANQLCDYEFLRSAIDSCVDAATVIGMTGCIKYLEKICHSISNESQQVVF